MRLFDAGRSLREQIGIFSNTRPLRIAFLLSDDDKAHENLDPIFAYSYSQFGGQKIPCRSGERRNNQ